MCQLVNFITDLTDMSTGHPGIIPGAYVGWLIAFGAAEKDDVSVFISPPSSQVEHNSLLGVRISVLYLLHFFLTPWLKKRVKCNDFFMDFFFYGFLKNLCNQATVRFDSSQQQSHAGPLRSCYIPLGKG